jgi:type VI protein secretion system component Hcp
MRKSQMAVAATLSGWMLGATPALAASDYLLQLDGVQGDAATKGHPAPIEISSWSWGASNPTSVGSTGMSAGKVNVRDMSVMSASAATTGVAAARDTTSGQASGKRSAQPVASVDAAAAPPPAGTVSELTLRLRESPSRPSLGQSASACTAGQHIDKVTVSSNGQSYELQDATVISCDVSGGETVMKVRGKTGHVTLMK